MELPSDGLSEILSPCPSRNTSTAAKSITTRQRTHVTTHATGLLLKYALDRQPQGLGLR